MELTKAGQQTVFSLTENQILLFLQYAHVCNKLQLTFLSIQSPTKA